MKELTTRAKISWTLGALGAAAALLISMFKLWPTIGWVSPALHNADIADVEHDNEIQVVLDAISLMETNINAKVDMNRDEWWCDEEEEYLDDLIVLQDAGNLTTALSQEIMEQRDKMAVTQCVRFDND